MLDIDIDQIREKYESERQLYKAFANFVYEKINEEIRLRGIKVSDIQYRAKEVESYVKKVLRPKYSGKQINISDKAGVRIIVTYFDLVQEISSLISEVFVVRKIENKLDNLDPNKLGYLGIHYEVSLPEGLISDDINGFRDLICEIQLHTQAQGLWASISHELLYKPDEMLPIEYQRILYRLIALVEIFDNEVLNVKTKIASLKHSEEIEILLAAERYFRRLASKVQSYDKELSLEIIKNIKDAYNKSEKENIDLLLKNFLERDQNSEKIVDIWLDYSNDPRRNPILFQPEILLIFERLEKDEFVLKDLWERVLPIKLLEQISSIWGISV
jgi:ppGpp synthetase/RelA/SpoT-type nucleotidyltranferase